MLKGEGAMLSDGEGATLVEANVTKISAARKLRRREATTVKLVLVEAASAPVIV